MVLNFSLTDFLDLEIHTIGSVSFAKCLGVCLCECAYLPVCVGGSKV